MLTSSHKINELSHLVRLTDEFGIIQHAKGSCPDISSGYCLDDNSRAFIVALWYYRLFNSKAILKLLNIYFSFIAFCQGKDGRFYNFVDYKHRFIGEVFSDDASGRALWALGIVASTAPVDGTIKEEAKKRFLKGLRHTENFSLRAKAYSLLGMVEYYDVYKDKQVRTRILALGSALAHSFKQNSDNEWKWFEDRLTYDNAILPLTLFKVYKSTENKTFKDIAMMATEFLDKIVFRNNRLSVIGNKGWYVKGGKRAIFDQQPIDAGSMVYLMKTAFEITGDIKYLRRIKQAYNWYFGENDLGKGLYDCKTKGCSDGLSKNSVSKNQGAESTICFLMSAILYHNGAQKHIGCIRRGN